MHLKKLILVLFFVPLLGAGHAPQSDTPETILRLVSESTAAATHQARPDSA